jgi:hypothetical protein
MAVLTNDQAGRLAELIAATDLSRPVKGRVRRPLFRATFLGDKYPIVDILIDVLGRNDTSLGFFFAQVKGSTAVTAAHARLPVGVKLDRFNQLARIPAPTYLIGVDLPAETAYLVAAHRPRKVGVSTITKVFCLRDDAVRIELHKEVLAFWAANKPVLQLTRFHDV